MTTATLVGTCALCPPPARPTPATRTLRQATGDTPCCEKCWRDAVTAELFAFLTTGTPPAGFTFAAPRPALSPQHAMSVIYVLQEWAGLLPDYWELCTGCGRFFNSQEEYYTATDRGVLCQDCAPVEDDEHQEE